MFAVQQTRWADYIRRLIGFKGGLTLATLPDCMPTVDLEDERPELALPQGVALWYGWLRSPAVAGQYSQARIEAPASTNRLHVLKAIQNTGTVVRMAVLTGAALGTGGVSFPAPRDLRVAAISGGVEFRSASGAIAPAATDPSIAPTGALYDFEWVINPGQRLQLTSFTVNQDLDLAFFGYSRYATPDELALNASAT